MSWYQNYDDIIVTWTETSKEEKPQTKSPKKETLKRPAKPKSSKESTTPKRIKTEKQTKTKKKKVTSENFF